MTKRYKVSFEVETAGDRVKIQEVRSVLFADAPDNWSSDEAKDIGLSFKEDTVKIEEVKGGKL